MRARFRLLAFGFLLLPACAPEVRCGDGTREEGGVCVADPAEGEGEEGEGETGEGVVVSVNAVSIVFRAQRVFVADGDEHFLIVNVAVTNGSAAEIDVGLGFSLAHDDGVIVPGLNLIDDDSCFDVPRLAPGAQVSCNIGFSSRLGARAETVRHDASGARDDMPALPAEPLDFNCVDLEARTAEEQLCFQQCLEPDCSAETSAFSNACAGCYASCREGDEGDLVPGDCGSSCTIAFDALVTCAVPCSSCSEEEE